MKKDGTIYLCIITFNSDIIKEPKYELLHWGLPCGFSDIKGIPGWLNQSNFKIKIKEILSYKEMPNIKELKYENL